MSENEIGEFSQHYNQYKQNEDYHLMTHSNEEEIMRQNSNAFSLPEERN